VPTQPIAIEDLVAYLVAALKIEDGESEVLEIGGADVVSYADLMREYGRQRGLRRLMIPVPLLTPRLSSLWLGLVTPIYARVGRELIGGLRNPTVVHDCRALERFPIRPRGVREAIHRALTNEDNQLAQTRWSGALSSSGGMPTWAGVRFGSRILDSRWVRLSVEPRQAFAPIRRIGGDVGWYYGTWLWRIRGVMDLLVGGPGLRRGRRDPEQVVPGEPLDFWRVEAYEPDRLLRLAAEMRLPGRAWLQFEVQPGEGGVEIHQTAIFDPIGLGGLAYWYLLYPAHQVVFLGMLRGIARAALAEAGRKEGIQIRSAH
jgi:hypothetical protein